MVGRAPPPETTSKIKGREGARKRSISKLDRAASAKLSANVRQQRWTRIENGALLAGSRQPNDPDLFDAEGGSLPVLRQPRIWGRNMAAADGDDDGAAATILSISLPATRPRGRKAILVPGNAGSGPRRVDQALVLALARARSWMRVLRRGEYGDTVEIARRFGLSDPHVYRLLRSAYLAPDFVEAIVEDRQPRSLTVKLLLQGLTWSDQCAAFGFSH
jgi:hypothetical protein